MSLTERRKVMAVTNTTPTADVERGVRTVLIVIAVIAAVASLWLGGWKGLLFTVSAASLMMYFHLMFTSIANAFIGNAREDIGGVFWKVAFIIASATGFGIYFNV